MTSPDSSPSPPTPGQIALSAMGWLELAVSVVLFALGVYIAAAAFGLAALFLTFVATQIRRQRTEHARRAGREAAPPPPAARPGFAFWAQLAAGAALIVASVVFLLLGNIAYVANFLIWGLVLGLFAQRAAQTG
jgi:hypothetical protein